MRASIKYISYVLPTKELTNAMLHEKHPEWPIEKIFNKTGIYSRRIAEPHEYSLELAIQVGKKLFQEHNIQPKEIDFVIFCSLSPKHIMPISACVIQNALSIPTSAGAFDMSLGCSGYVYALTLAESLVVSKKAKNVLLINADTYTKVINDNDRNLKTLFGDGAAASLITIEESEHTGMKVFDFGTDGSGSKRVTTEGVGMQGLMQGKAYEPDLYMDGPGIFNFTLEKIPGLIDKILAKANTHFDDIDLFIFHQANGYMLEHIREKLGIRKEKFFVYIEQVGNTVSSTIPIAFYEAIKQGKIVSGKKIMLVSFGAGLSWASVILDY